MPKEKFTRKIRRSSDSFVTVLIRAKFILLACTLIVSAGLNAFAQGANTPQGKESGNKADQNLKSSARVNPSTLAMEFGVPLMNYPGRNGNSLTVGFSYSSKVWRMDNRDTYFTTTPIGGYRQYITHLSPQYAERSASGWTSTTAFPTIEENLETYDQYGDSFSFSVDALTLNNQFSSFLQDNSENNVPGPATSCGWNCIYWCAGDNCACIFPYYSNWGCSPSQVDWPTGGGGSPPQAEPARRMHYMKRVRVRMGDGTTHEFRKSDAVFGYCSGGPSENEGPNCEGNGADNLGTFLSVDGSGTRLERTVEGSTLFMPDGSRFLFPALSTGFFDEHTLYQATDHVDSNGNRSTVSNIGTGGQPALKLTDTLGREVVDPFSPNFWTQRQSEGKKEINLPGINGGNQKYEANWLHLKPVECTGTVTTNCGGTEGALEDQNERLYHYASVTCGGSLYTLVDSNGLNPASNRHPDEILFPTNGWGLRSCNPFDVIRVGDTNTAVPARFNPVVLAEIELPNGKKYVFKYNHFGEITKIIYPAGNYETFKYAKIPPMNGFNDAAYDQTNRGVVERKVYTASGTLEQRWRYSTEAGKVTTIAPKPSDPMGDGAKTEKFLHFANQSTDYFGLSGLLAGMPKEEKAYDELGQLRTRSLMEWILAPPRTGGNARATRDPRVKRTVSVAIDNGQALATLSESEYDDLGHSDPEYFSHLNVKRSKSHHYRNIPLSLAQTGTLIQIASYFNSATVAASSETDYIYDETYKNRGISSLVRESRSLDPANNSILAKSQVIYDNQTPTSSPTYPSGYSVLGYSGVASTLDCAELAAPPKICWQDPNSSYLGRPTTSRLWDSDNNVWIETHTRYDIFGSVVAARDPIGNEASTLFENSTTKPYKYAYPTRVDTSAPDPTNTHGTNEGSFATTTYDFMTGLPLTSTNEFNQTTATEYNDPLLRPTRSYAVNFAAPESQTIYDDNALTVKVRKQIDENNWDEATTFMDSLGRSVKTKAKDSQGDVFVETKYDFLGRVERVSNPYRLGDTVLWSKTRYDEAGRAVESYAPAEFSNLSTAQSLGTTTFDISTAPGFIGTVVTTTDAADKKGRSFTNALGQLIRVDEPDHAGGLAPLVQATPNPDPTPTPPGDDPEIPPPGCTVECLTNTEYPSYSTVYQYNAQGKMVQVTQGVQKRFFLYDSLGRLIRVRQPEQEINPALAKNDPVTNNSDWTAGFTYDVLGNVLTATDANGVTITNNYDRAGRVKIRSYSGGPAGQTTPAVSFFYDGKGLDTTQIYAKGKLTKVENTVSQTRYTVFDNLGRLKESEQRTPVGTEIIANAIPRVSKYTYNFSGALIEEEYPSGRKVKNEFESDGDLSRIYGTANVGATERTYANSFTYTPDGRIERLRLGNRLWEAAKFNMRLQVTELALGHGVSSGDLWKLGYEYGELNTDGTVNTVKNTGNIAKQTLSFNGLTQPFVQAYKYDSLYRLTEARETAGTGGSAPQTWKQNFTYDRYGNRLGHEKFIGTTQLSQTTLTHPAIDPATNRFTAGQNYGFDKNGNLTTDPENRAFTFNGDNKQSKVVANGLTVGEYFYDGEGKRVKKKAFVGGVLDEETIFVYSNGKMIAEYSNKPPAQNPTTSYTMTDQLGSPRILTNSLGEVVSRRDFMPFGEEILPDGNRTANLKYKPDGIRQKFTGYQKDEETQLDFAEARMYENRHGRFTAVDPLLASGKSANPQTFNRYVYVLNNPLIYTDPSGLQVATSIWYGPTIPDGIKPYRFASSQPEGYEPVTQRNRLGQLIGAGAGLDSNHVLHLNPNGPYVPRPSYNSDVPNGADFFAPFLLSDYDYKGYAVIASDAYEESSIEHPADGYTRGSENVTLELFSVFQGGGSLLRAGVSRLGTSTAFRGASAGTVTTTERLPASAFNFTDGIQKGRLKAIADDVYTNGVKTPVDYTVINGQNYLLNGNHRTMLARTFGQDLPAQRQSLPFGSWRNEDEVLMGNSLYGRPLSDMGCRMFCKNYTPPSR